MRAPLLLAVLAACNSDKNGDENTEETGTPAVPTGAGLFAEGCPPAGRSVARVVGVDARLDGAVAVGGRGDLLLANEHAAYVITRPDAGSTYYYYGGIVADAAPMDGCAQAAPDGLDEVGLVLAELEIVDFERSIVRDFRADTVVVLADGSDGGPAVVRATGTDDMHWLVEYELIRELAGDGGRPLSEPFGLEIVVDYVLAPGSPALRVEWSITNPTDTTRSLLSGALLSFAPSYETASAGASAVELGGLSMTGSIPYVSAGDAVGSFAYGLDRGNLAYTRIAGIDVAVNLDQVLLEPLALPPGGTATTATVITVEAGMSAAGALVGADPDRLPGGTATATVLDGTVTDASGDPVPGARVDLWGDGGSGADILDIAWTDASGAYRLPVPAFSPAPWTLEIAASAPGRDPGPRTPITDGALTLGPAGAVDLSVDEGGVPVPARLVLVRDDGARVDIWTDGEGSEPVPPGTWSWTLTRGFEYEPVTGDLVVPPDGAVELRGADLERVVDTVGWLSVDTHVHSAWSPDSRVPAPVQTLHGAAHGVDVLVHSEHEIVVDETDNPVLAGIPGHVASVNGEEMTATVPEHMTMFPLVPDGSPRGGPVAWYQMDIDEVFDAMHERSGGGINILNHPGYMDLVGWDYVAAEPTMTDPTLIGLHPGAALWSWDLEGVEVMNGHASPFADGNARFEKWQSMLNAGHLVFPAGCSDDHGGDEVGFPRTYVQSATDAPGELDVDALVDALRAGQVSVSDGAFARVHVDGVGPGGLVAGSGSVALSVTVSAPAAIDVTHVVVFANCDEVAQLDATDPHGVVKLDAVVDVPVDGDTQIVVAAFGADLLPLGLPQFDPTTTPRALTGAILVDGDGSGAFDAPGGRICAYDVAR